MSEQGLDGSDVRIVLEKMCRKRMAERVGRDSFGDSRAHDGSTNPSLGAGFVKGVSAEVSALSPFRFGDLRNSLPLAAGLHRETGNA